MLKWGVAATEVWAGVRAWIDRLGLQIKDAAQHVGMETDQLERVLNFPDGATPARVLLQVLEGLGLGIVGVESLTPAMLLRHFDQVRETKGMSKKDLSIRADVHRTYLIGLFQELKPEPKLALSRTTMKALFTGRWSPLDSVSHGVLNGSGSAAFSLMAVGVYPIQPALRLAVWRTSLVSWISRPSTRP